MKPQSFFDDEEKVKLGKFWEKLPQKQEISDLQNIYLFNSFYKKTRTPGKTKQLYYILSQEGLYQADMETQVIKGYVQTICMRMELLQEIQNFISIDSNLQDQNVPLNGFKLSLNGKQLEIYTTDPLQWKNWKNVLIYRCLQSSFHEEFVVTKMIGKGSFAKVYLATKKSQNIQYAIKAFNKEFMQNQHKGKESLINEIYVMRQLDSDHLIRLYEVYETANSIYFVVDLLQGGELLHRIREKGSLNEKQLKLLMKNLIQALHHLHVRNIMHRDLKPENLLLKNKNSDYDIIVADFGLSTRIDMKDSDILFKRCGTPGFVAPEVLGYREGDKLYGVQCDIFSAGIIFFLLLTGKQPFQGKDYKQILRANKLCEINFEIPELTKFSANAIDLLKKMLNALPDQRLSAQQCLEHPFLEVEDQQIGTENNICGSLGQYEVEYLANVRNKQLDSQDMTGSMALYSTGKLPMNGNINTVDSFSNASFSNMERKMTVSQGPGQSKFGNQQQTTQESVFSIGCNTPTSNKKGNDNNLFKQALKNNISKFAERSDSLDIGNYNSPTNKNVQNSDKKTPSKFEEYSKKQ